VHAELAEAAPARRRPFGPVAWGMLVVALAGWAVGAVRLFTGLGPVTNLTDRFPWGIWIGIDVATGVALSAGGFTVAALAHVFHRDRYHPLARAGLLSAMLGYTFVVLGLLFDLGRYYNVWHPMMPSMWSGHSVLFEVGMCVMAYLMVLYSEFVPIATERFLGRVDLPGPLGRLNGLAEGTLRIADTAFGRAMPFLVIAGVVLSCLHQSSLGSLMLIAPSKMHPLWYTPILPLLFLLSAIAVGFPVVVFESHSTARALGRRPETALIADLAKFLPPLLGIVLVMRLADLAIRDTFGHLLAIDGPALAYGAELVFGLAIPIALMSSERIRRSPRGQLTAAILVVVGVALNRIDVFLTAYTPPIDGPRYTPAVSEIVLTLGLFATLALVYRWVVTVFPVLPPEEPEERTS
jgi:Ni/Fe-hydrogenase subunit HybB-like protein